MDTLYVLCRSIDGRHTLPLAPAEAAEICAAKKAHFAAEARANPLVREILAGGRLDYHGLAADNRRGFLAGPATFFRTHEILRKTREADTPIAIGGREFPRAEVLAMFARCVPNVRLQHFPWWSPARYRLSLALAWGATLATAHAVARSEASGALFDGFVLYYMGGTTTLAALVWTALHQNRDVRHAAPWNSAMYLDFNADLLRRESLALAAARKEFLPQQRPFKTPRFYYALAARIADHGLDAELARRLAPAEAPRPAAESVSTAGRQSQTLRSA